MKLARHTRLPWYFRLAVPIEAWTDYPILRLGDLTGEVAPIRHCTVLYYDDDKYCIVRVGRYHESIKRGYIYTRRGRAGEIPTVSIKRLTRYKREI